MVDPVLTVRPEGVEVAVSVTVPANPPEAVIETLNVPLPPLTKLIVLGLTLTEKSGVGVGGGAVYVLT
jgi:hypothetical protein